MSGPAGVLALVLAETAAGGCLFLWLAPLWGKVRRGFFVLTGGILAAVAFAAAGAATAGREAGASGAPQLLAVVLAGTATLATLLLVAKRDRWGRAAGLLTVPLSIAVIGAFGVAGSGSPASGVFQRAAGAAFMGAVLDGLLLGHWYLVDRGLSRGPINAFAVLLLLAVGLEAIAVVMAGFGNVQAGPSFSPLLSAAGVASYLALGMVLATALIAVMIRLTLRGARASAVQAATGFFYLAVITASAGEIAAKIRFVPGR